MSFNLEIISPQQTIFNDEIELCILPGIEGDFGILKKPYAVPYHSQNWNSIHLQK